MGITRDDNLFRAPAEQALADRYLTSLLLGELDLGIGRQRLQARAALRDQRYQNQQELNHLDHEARLAWSGETEGSFSWTLSRETARRLTSYATVQADAPRGTDTETVDQTLAEFQLGLLAQWAARLALSQRRVDHSAAVFERERVRLDAVGLGLQWNPLGPLSVSVGPRYTRGHVPPAAGGLRRDFERHDLDLGLHWITSGASVLHSRLSLTRQRHDAPDQGDYSGATGALDWSWAITGKSRLRAAISHETGSETAFFTPAAPGMVLSGTGGGSQLTTALTARLDHDLTGKITLGLDAQYARRQLAQAVLQADGSLLQLKGSDRSALLRLGLRYAATRSTVIACDIGQERRSAGSTLSTGYRVNTVACNAQLTLRWS